MTAPMTARQLEILQHSLGVDQYGQTPKGFTPYTRNYFDAGDSDEPSARSMASCSSLRQSISPRIANARSAGYRR
jgi:hypothetical protein